MVAALAAWLKIEFRHALGMVVAQQGATLDEAVKIVEAEPEAGVRSRQDQ